MRFTLADAAQTAGQEPETAAALPALAAPCATVAAPDFARRGGGAAAAAAASVAADDPLLLVYTSGTTGRPKGAVLSHRQMWWTALTMAATLDYGRRDTDLIAAPLFHVGGLSFATLSVYLGACSAILPAWDAGAVLRLIAEARIDHFFAVAAMVETLVAHPDFAAADLSSLRWVMAGGAPVPAALVEAFAARDIPLLQTYGTTETGGPATVVALGTATVFDAVSANGEYLGGAIAPGIALAADALYANTSLLRRVQLSSPETAIGKSTVHSLQSGIVLGYTDLVKGMVSRFRAELGEDCKVIGTGGLAVLFDDAGIFDTIDLDLTLTGLKLIYRMNQNRH